MHVECSDDLKLFDTRSEWRDHDSHHRLFWKCSHCAVKFNSEDECSSHLIQEHSIEKNSEFQTHIRGCKVDEYMQPVVVCPLCGGEEISVFDLQRHICTHQESLALLVLPLEYIEGEIGKRDWSYTCKNWEAYDDVSLARASAGGRNKQQVLSDETVAAIRAASPSFDITSEWES